MRSRTWIFGVLMIGVLMLAGSVTRGHAPIASRFTYNEEIFPIFVEHCGACHIEGGNAPMSFLTYKEAYPWAQSIREEVLALRMPTWRAEDGFGEFRNGHAFPVKEMDMLLEWASGRYPQGPLDKAPAPVTMTQTWALGEPELLVEVAEEFSVTSDVSEAVRYFVLPADIDQDRWISAVDFRPGAPAVVRSAAVYVDTTGKAVALDAADDQPGFGAPADGSFPTSHPISVWTPGLEPVMLGESEAYPVGASANLVLRIHYKKNWMTEGQAFDDRSSVGLYFSDARPQAVETMIITSPEALSGREATFTHTVEADLSALALLPEVSIETTDIQVEAIHPDGVREPLLLLREPDAAWPTRYWFESPVTLPKGTRIEVKAFLRPGADRIGSTSLLAGAPNAPVRFLLDYVPGVTTAN